MSKWEDRKVWLLASVVSWGLENTGEGGAQPCECTKIIHLYILSDFFKKVFFNFLCMSVLLSYLYVYYMCPWCLQRSEEGVGSPELELQWL